MCLRFMAEDKRKLILVSIHNLPSARCISAMNFLSCCDSCGLCISCCHSSGLSNLWFVHVLWLVFEIISCCSMFLDLLDVEHLALASTLSVFGNSFSDLLSLLFWCGISQFLLIVEFCCGPDFRCFFTLSSSSA